MHMHGNGMACSLSNSAPHPHKKQCPYQSFIAASITTAWYIASACESSCSTELDTAWLPQYDLFPA